MVYRPLILGGALAAAFAASAFAGDPEISFGRVDFGGRGAVPPASPSSPPLPGPTARDARPALKSDSRVHPYVGLEAGGSGSTLEGVARANPNGVAATDPDRHVRAQAGVDYTLNPKVDLGLGYRYSNADRPALVLASAPDTELQNQQRDQAAMFSLRYHFGPGG